MPTKAELIKEIYLLLAVIHLHDFEMTPEMAQKIFDRWPAIIPDRPESPEDVMNNYNDLLNQRPAESLATQTPTASQNQTPIKKETTLSPFRLSNYSVKRKLEPKPKPKPKPQTTTPHTPDLVSSTIFKTEPTTEVAPIKPSTTTTIKSSTAKRVLVDLTDAISSDDEEEEEDETPTKKLKMG